MSLGATTFTAVPWTTGDVITETKMDNMQANTQAYDSHAAQGILLNNNVGYYQKDSGGNNREILNVNAGDQLLLGNGALDEVLLMSGIGVQDGFMFNGKIVRSIASNNLTVALKGRDGNDPSATNPVFVVINSTIYAITSALSVTANAGTNWADAGGTKHATQDIDYFTYLGVRSGAVFIGFARIPNAETYADFSVTTTNEKYLRYSGSAPSSTDPVVVIGRFNATLSASASFNWSNSVDKTKQKPIYKTRKLTTNPTYSASGSMTYGTVTTSYAIYQIIEDDVHYELFASGTTGGTANNELIATLPFNASYSAGSKLGAGAIVDTSLFEVGLCFISSSALGQVSARKSASTNYGLGASRQMGVDIWYKY